jgi:hypothetical protein
MMKAEPARLPFWHERQILADAKRDDRRAAVLNRFARAVRVQIAINRLAGFGAPGIGGLLEEARKKAELRNTKTVTTARKILDSGDGEALVLSIARAEEERHEAVAGLALEVVINRAEQGRQAEQIEKLKQEKEKAEREMGREQRLREVMQEDVGRLRERLRREAMRMERLMADERRKAERLAKAERKAMGREIRQLENQVNQGWQEEVGELKSEIKQLRQLTDLMVTGKKRAAEEAQEREYEAERDFFGMDFRGTKRKLAPAIAAPVAHEPVPETPPPTHAAYEQAALCLAP